MKLRSPLALALALAACAPLAPEEREEAGLEQPLLAPGGDGVLAPDPSTPSYARPSALDGLGAAAPAALDLTTGHRVQVPVSAYHLRTETYGVAGGNNSYALKTMNCSGDTGILLRVRRAGRTGAWVATVYNDDGPAAELGASGSSPAKGSFVSFTSTEQLVYEAHVFGQGRGAARCTLWRRLGTGAWTSLGALSFGGTLVEVGALAADGFVEVRTPRNGLGGTTAEGTRLVLFEIGTAAVHAPTQRYLGRGDVLAGRTDRPLDLDPIAEVSRSASAAQWTGTRVYALLGKTATSNLDNTGVEHIVDLVRGPLNQLAVGVVTYPASGGTTAGQALAPGRYAFVTRASATRPVGDDSVVRHMTATTDYSLPLCSGFNQDNLPDSCHEVWSWEMWGSDFEDDPTHPWARGALNENALELAVERQQADGSWAAVRLDSRRTVRRVPLGAFGGTGWHRLLAVFDVPTAGTYRLRATRLAGTVALAGEAHVVRNPDATELRVSTLNMFYREVPSDSLLDAEFRNAAELLMARGRIDRAAMRVDEPADQAPYQWDSDVVFLTESKSHRWFESFQAQAEQVGPDRVALVHAYNEEFDLPLVHDGMGAVLVGDRFWPEPGSSWSIRGEVLGAEYCSADIYGPSCNIDGADAAEICATDNFIIPARVKVNATPGGVARPVMVLGAHLQHSIVEVQTRLGEIHSLANRVESLLVSDPYAFNAQGSTDPRAPGNRVVIVGDINAYTDACGEHYQMLRALRARFGYAVDLALAVEDAVEYAYGMHGHGNALGADGFPTGYLPGATWAALDDASAAKWAVVPGQGYPWWARTWTGDTAMVGRRGDRHDMIILVGRGWEGDDPARAYAVMQANALANPFAARQRSGAVLGGVEMYHNGSGAGGVPDAYPNYRPTFAVGNGTCNGCAALQTDHRPVGARLQITLLGTADDR